jgi:alpha-tubulin suppressor-like RCC1 family protein
MRLLSLALLALALLAPGCHWLFPHRGAATDGGAGEQRPTELGSDAPAAPPAVRALAAGARHTCALLEDDSIRCWGDGESGQLGDGRRGRSTSPVLAKVPPGVRPEALAAGDEHSCYLAAGEVACWGDNSGRQSASDSTDGPVLEPRPVVGVAKVSALALGSRETCVLHDGTVSCFGRQKTFHEVLVGARGLACGGDHCCALAGADVLCWGRSPHGEAGTFAEEVKTPIPVANLPGDVEALSCGSEHCCARSAGNALLCWGSNGVNQLGAAAQGDYDAAVPAPVGGVVEVAAGGYHTCARGKLDEVLCFGYGRFGQLGRGELGGDGSKPMAASGLAARAIVTGVQHSCAIVGAAREQIWCFGLNTHGQCGVSPTCTASPVLATLPASDELAAGGNHTCALAGGELRCWGYNSEGQLGDGTQASRGVPATVTVPSASGAAGWSGVGRGGLHSCGLLAGDVWCWGAGWAGQLGQGKGTVTLAPIQAKGVKGATLVVGGHDHSCALTSSGVFCWGSHARGQLGIGAVSADLKLPTPVVGLPGGITALDARNATSCAVDGQGKVWCWGDNRGGQLGPAVAVLERGTPGVVAGTSAADEVAVGGYHVCARTKSAEVECWGDNDYGQLGGGNTKPSATPAAVPGLEGVVQLCAGWWHTCARRGDGSVACWGLNSARQAGVVEGQLVFKPAAVPLGDSAIDLRCGWEHTCVRLKDRSVRCWGSFHLGQLGDGQITKTASPVRIYP